MRLCLPPLNEQRRIVAKIEALFSELDKGIESLKTAQAQLKVYRQAVLKHAFEGKLTADWRARNYRGDETGDQLLVLLSTARSDHHQTELKDWRVAVEEWERSGRKGKKPPKPRRPKKPEKVTTAEVAELCQIPNSWAWVRPEHVMSPTPYSIGIGPFGSNLKVADYRTEGVPLVFVRNITRSNFRDGLKYIDLSKFSELQAHVVLPLDIVITKMGDPPGDCEIYPEDCEKAVLTADCLKFRIWNHYVDRKFYKYCIQSNYVKKQLGLITKGVAQKKISVDRFKTLALPLPPQNEQRAIVAAVENVLSKIDAMEQELADQFARIASLRQSILKKAFAGQLVPQDPRDEPASVVLERIRAEKAQSKKIRKPRTSSKKRAA